MLGHIPQPRLELEFHALVRQRGCALTAHVQLREMKDESDQSNLKGKLRRKRRYQKRKPEWRMLRVFCRIAAAAESGEPAGSRQPVFYTVLVANISGSFRAISFMLGTSNHMA